MKTVLALLFTVIGCAATAQPHLVAVNKFLSSLNDSLRSLAKYQYEDSERFNWWFVPRARNGLSFHAMSAPQKEAATNLLKASLSQQGYQKASGILSLEAILRNVEGRGQDDSYRDPLNYYFTIFGDPSTDQPWGWRIEGHHLSLNFTSAKGAIEAATPSFLGANPAIIPRGIESGKQVLKQESNLGFLLVNALSAAQLKEALFSKTAPADIFSGNRRKAEQISTKGILYSALTESQQNIFLQLLDVYVKNYTLGFSAKFMEKIRKTGIENLSFAWAGGMQPGEKHYYRIQGPMLLIEYDNTQNNGNHVHTVVRDLTNDFAEDILREHYEKEHK